MRNLIFLALLICSVSCSESDDWATVTIPSNQSFFLGELESTSFKAQVKNLSNKEVDFKVVDTKTKAKKSGFGISEKGQVEVFVAGDEMAVFINNNDQEVQIKVLLNKDVEGMRYVEH